MTDQDIVEGFLVGRSDSARVVVNWIRSVVEHSAWGRTIWKEDVVSDAVYRVLVALREQRFRHECSLQTYISRIARYAVIDWIRRERRRAEMHALFRWNEAGAVDDQLFLEEARRRAVIDRVWEQIDEKCRRLWAMIFHEHLDYAAIAERNEVAVGTIKTWVFRCKEKAVALADQGKRS